MPRHRRRPDQDEPTAPAERSASAPPAAVAASSAAVAALHPAIGPEMVLELQRSAGNAYVSRMPGVGAHVARYRRPDTAAESVAADESTAVDLPGARGRKLEIGDKGYTDRALDILPAVAGELYASDMTQKQLLTAVTPRFGELNRTLRWMEVQAQRAEKNSDTSFGGIADRAKADQQRWLAAGVRLTDAAATEERLCKEFNAGIPRANRVFVSLAKLDGMLAIMGIRDPKAMVAAVVSSLREAGPVRDALKRSGAAAEKMTVPAADESAAKAATELTSAQEAMGNAWIGVQQTLEADRADAVLKEGEADAKRKLEIEKDLAQLRNVGKAIDVSMAVMGIGITGKTESGGLRGALAGGGKTVDDKGEWSGGGVPGGLKAAGSAVASGVGLEIPTSAGGVLETAAKLYYFGELERIHFHLGVLEKEAAAHREVAAKLGILQKLREFDKALKDFERAQTALQDTLAARRRAYLTFGQQLDETAAKSHDRAARAEAPGRGDERFTTVLALTALAREVLVMVDGAEEGLGSDEQGRASAKLKVEFDKLWDVNGWSSHYRQESPALGDALRQLRRFEGSVDVYREHLAAIDTAATELLGPLVGGEQHAKY
ncbi:MAG TPA: hypothetical protein VFM58_19795 [Solirubrobacteraceae bacterium]|nr:hypothetical protein [Solirubrobacteraceae bacterium]